MSHSPDPVDIVVQSSDSAPAPLENEEQLEVHSSEAHLLLMPGLVDLDSSVKHTIAVTPEVAADGSVKEERLKEGPGETLTNPSGEVEGEQASESTEVVEEGSKPNEGTQFCGVNAYKSDVYLSSLTVSVHDDNMQEITLDAEVEGAYCAEVEATAIKLASIPPVPKTTPGLPQILYSIPSSSSQAVPVTAGSDILASTGKLYAPSKTIYAYYWQNTPTN
jgi:hypothetical protein